MLNDIKTYDVIIVEVINDEHSQDHDVITVETNSQQDEFTAIVNEICKCVAEIVKIRRGYE